jgi:hypothetical protein
MKPNPDERRDVMLVCRNGHVITDLLQTYPERALAHCDRCGATTLDRCPTCGQRFLGATHVPGLNVLGTMAAPDNCFFCGAAMPWVGRAPSAAAPTPLSLLETLLRRLPRTIRQLRTRYADRPPFRARDEHDLEDLLRAVLPLHFDAICLESRTPAYAPCTRTDFRLGEEEGNLPVALTAKVMNRENGEVGLGEQWQQDVAYYARVRDCRTLVGFVYDPEGLIREPGKFEALWGGRGGELQCRCVVAG